jgi:hypothetical protein
MTILNRRNAFLGWVVWQTGKRVARRKARNALPSIGEEGKPRKRKRRAVAAGIAAAAGAVLFWRRRAATPDTFDE